MFSPFLLNKIVIFNRQNFPLLLFPDSHVNTSFSSIFLFIRHSMLIYRSRGLRVTILWTLIQFWLISTELRSLSLTILLTYIDCFLSLFPCKFCILCLTLTSIILEHTLKILYNSIYKHMRYDFLHLLRFYFRSVERE